MTDFTCSDPSGRKETVSANWVLCVAFAIADCRDALTDIGIVISEADAIGGGSRSRFWLSVLANVLNIPIHRFADGETGAAFGAARLGRLAITGEAIEAVCTPPRRIETFEPERALAEAYTERLRNWRRLRQET